MGGELSGRSVGNLSLGNHRVVKNSMDWLTGRSEPETIVFPMKIMGFPVTFPLNQSIDGTILWAV